MTASCPKNPNIAEISPHLICALCGGYLIDATTIVECLHSFCKTCIVRYLESSKYCPICEVLVHKTRPLQNIRLDHTLQNIVYKLVPGLFQDEMKRRREFYKDSPTVRSSQTRQEQQRHRIIYSADEKFSVALEFCPDGRIRKPTSRGRGRRLSKTEPPERRYLLCPANTTIALLKKFMKLKFFLNEKFKVDIFHMDGNLRDHYQLMDVAYIYSYKREGVLQLYYSVQKTPNPEPKVEITVVKTETNIQHVTGSWNENEARRIFNMDDNRPSSLFSNASLLSNHRMGGNIEHDLSPLELIATVANDLSSYQEGRCLKRKTNDADLFENDEDNSNSKEIQIQKSIEHAIDICSSNSNHGNADKPEDKTSLSQDANKLKAGGGRSGSPALARTDIALKASNKQKCLKTTPNLFDNIVAKVTKLPPKEKPKTTDTASQCEPRQKKQKVGDPAVQGSNPHSKSPTKSQKLSQQSQHQKLQQQHQQQQQSKPEVVQNHVTEKSKSSDDMHRQEKDKAKVIVNNNNNNNVEHNGAITARVVETTPKDTTSEVVKAHKVVAVPLPATVSNITCQKTSVIKTNSECLKPAGNANLMPQTNGFTNSVKASLEKQPQVAKTKHVDKE